MLCLIPLLLCGAVTIEQPNPHRVDVYVDGEPYTNFTCTLELHDFTWNQDLSCFAARGFREPNPATPQLYAGHAVVAWWQGAFVERRLPEAPAVVRVSGDVLVWLADDWHAYDLPARLPLLVGDLNGDGRVSVGDLSILGAHWGQPATWHEGDLNGDWTVDVSDVSILSARWGSHVPEPIPLLLLLAGAGMTTARRRV